MTATNSDDGQWVAVIPLEYPAVMAPEGVAVILPESVARLRRNAQLKEDDED